MAVVSRVAQLTLTDGVSGTRSYAITADLSAGGNDHYASGSGVVLTMVQTQNGATLPANPDTITISVLIDDTQTVIRSFTVTPSNVNGNSQTFTFNFTSDGTASGAARSGTLKLKIAIANTSGSAVQNYTANTDSNPADTRGTGCIYTTSFRDKGYVIADNVVTSALSNVAIGVAAIPPASYGESLFARTTLASTLYTARALTVAISNATPALSGATNSAASGNYDVTFAAVVDNRFPAASAARTTSVTVPNATLTALPDFGFTATNGSLTVDPRLTFTPLLQVNDASYGTPPLVKDIPSHQRLTTALAFLAWNARDSRGTLVGTATTRGVNGLAWVQHLRDAGALTADQPQTVAVSATKGGEPGWSDSFQSWSAALPGGAWNFSAVLTTANAVGLEVTASTTYTLVAADPNIRIVVGAGPAAGEDNHLKPGSNLLVGLTLINMSLAQLITPDTSPGPGVIIARFNQTLGRAEYLNAARQWVSAGGGATLYINPLTVSAGDPQVYTAVIPMLAADVDATKVWGTQDLFFVGRVFVAGTPYTGPAFTPVLSGSANAHSSYVVDPIGLALAGVISQR